MVAASIGLTDPGYLRHCLIPRCGASLNIGAVFTGRERADGWRLVAGTARLPVPSPGARCRVRGAPAVVAEARRSRGLAGDGLFVRMVVDPRRPATQGEHQRHWAAHLADDDHARQEAATARTGDNR